jgi:predicted transposase/invertase (TIGR01784 family)
MRIRPDCLALKRKKLDDDNSFSLKYGLAKTLRQKQFPKNKINKLLIFLRSHVHFDNSAYKAKFDKAIEVLTNNRMTMDIREMVLDRAKKEGLEKGREEGLEKGLEKGKTEVVKNLLSSGEFTIAKIANFAGVTEAFVRKVKKELK